MISLFPLLTAAAFGAIVGSFLNVCIHRLPRGASIVWPASACPHCERALSWYENIPVLSYLVLRGRCRTCAGPIAVRYPFVEALTAAMFALGWWYYGPGWLFASRLIFGCVLIVQFAIDLEHQLLPHAVSLFGIVAGLALSFVTPPGWQSCVLGMLLGAGLLYGIAFGWEWLRGSEGLGMGDPPMLAMIGAFLGWRMTLVTLMLASFSGTIVGVGLIASKRGGMASKLPFGTFLALGAAAAATVGPPLLDWYLGFF